MSWQLLQNTLLLGLGAALLATLAGASVFLIGLILPTRSAQGLSILAAINLLLPQYFVVAVWMEIIGDLQWMPLSSMKMAIALLAIILWPIPFFCLQIRQMAMKRAALIDPFLCGFALIQMMSAHARGALIWGILFSFALAVGNLAVPAILQIRVLTEEILVRFQTELDLQAVSILSLPLILLAFILGSILLHKQSWQETSRQSLSPRFLRQRFGTTLLVILILISSLTLLLGVCIPLGSLLFSAQTWGDLWATWKTSQRAAMSSVSLAFAAASILVIGGWMLRKIKGNQLAWCVLILPGTWMGACLATANNHLFSIGIDLGAWIIAPALALRFLGIGTSGATLAWNGVHRQLLNLARLEGISAWGQFRHCILPATQKGLLATWWLAYLLCLWEVELLLFLIPPGIETIGLRIFSLLHYGHNSQVHALCLLLILLGLAPYCLWKIGRRISTKADFQTFLLTIFLLITIANIGCGSGNHQHEGHLESRFFSHAQSIGFKGTGLGQFNKPRSLAVGKEDEVFAVDMTGRVQRFDASGAFLGFWQMPETERGRPKGMAVDLSGCIVVVEPHYARINHFSKEGELLLQWGRRGKEAGSLAFPRSVSVHSSGDLFVSEFQQTERIQRFSSDGSRFIQSFGEAGRDLGKFNRAEGIAFDAHDRLFVADSCNHRVQVFDEKGRLLAQYGKPGKNLGELSYPYDVRIDASGYQFVCEFGNSRVQVFDPDFTPVEIIGGPGSALGQFSNPWSLAMDSHGNLWVADSGNHRLQKLIRHPKKP